jgi:thiamine pyrophosphokinase
LLVLPVSACERGLIAPLPFVKNMRLVILANGVLTNLEAARRLILPDDLVVCADGGSRHARALGITPRLVVGDLDSTDATEQAALAAANVEIQRHPHDKDQTDLELALRYALDQPAKSIVIVGALGARLDHTLGNVSLLADPRLSDHDCCLDDGVERVVLCRNHVEIIGMPGDLVSLLPWNGRADGVRTEGLRWPLRGETLFPHQSRGISNELLGRSATVQLESGLLLVVHRRLAEAAAAN